MSKSTLSALKSEINAESKYLSSTCQTLKGLERSISNAMDDRVGHSARESIAAIENGLRYNMEKGYKSANNAASALDVGYDRMASFKSRGEAYLSQARVAVKELGEI